MEDCKDNERCGYYNKVILWVSLAPITIVFGLGALVAVMKPEMFGF